MAFEVLNTRELRDNLASYRHVIVDFFATWCGPCKKFEPVFEKLDEEYPSVKFLKANIGNVQEVLGEYQIMSVPTVMMFVNGEPVAVTKSPNATEVREMISKNA